MNKNNKRPRGRKLEIVFDSKNRREFLTGFRKRKNERKKRAKEELERLLKDERKRIKQEIKEGVKHLEKSYQPIPECEELLKKEDEIEDDQVVVKVTELTMSEMAEKENWLGENRPRYNDDEEDNNENDVSSDDEPNTNHENILGMSIVEEKSEKLKSKKMLESSNKNINEVKTKKDLDKIKQKQMLRSMKSSRIFKLKRNYDRLTNKKKAKQDKNQQLRRLRKEGKKKPKKYLAMQRAKSKNKKHRQKKQR